MKRAVLHFNRAVALERSGRYPEAIREYQDAARLNPFDLDTLIRLGLLLRELGRDEEANRVFEAALACGACSVTIGP